VIESDRSNSTLNWVWQATAVSKAHRDDQVALHVSSHSSAKSIIRARALPGHHSLFPHTVDTRRCVRFGRFELSPEVLIPIAVFWIKYPLLSTTLFKRATRYSYTRTANEALLSSGLAQDRIQARPRVNPAGSAPHNMRRQSILKDRTKASLRANWQKLKRGP
jgi:hypothetical protein